MALAKIRLSIWADKLKNQRWHRLYKFNCVLLITLYRIYIIVYKLSYSYRSNSVYAPVLCQCVYYLLCVRAHYGSPGLAVINKIMLNSAENKSRKENPHKLIFLNAQKYENIKIFSIFHARVKVGRKTLRN